MNSFVAKPSTLHPRLAAVSPWALALGVIAAIAATVAVAMAQAAWIGRPFPGFFVLPNRVVASIGRPGWAGTRDGAVYQSLVVAVDGAGVASSRDVYEHAAERDGRPVAYTLREGATSAVVTMPTQVFSLGDYGTIFGAYATTGLLYLLLGLLAAALLPAETGGALLVLGGIAGVYALSGAAIYSPGASLRLHALAEALFPAALLQLALVYPDRWRPAIEPWVALAWAASLAIGVPYQLVIDEPSAYSLVHGAAETYLGLAGLALAGRLTWELGRAPRAAGPLLRAATAGAVLGLGVPAIVVALSGLGGGKLPVNAVTAAAFAFPLCFSWGLLRERSAGDATAA